MLKWDEKIYGVGIPELDSQHKKIFQLINDMVNHFQKGEKDEALSQAAVELARYGAEHFSYEEKILETIGFPYLESHKKLHADGKKKIREYLLKLKIGKEISYYEVLAFLQEWVEKHIGRDDARYAEFYKSIKKKNKQKASV